MNIEKDPEQIISEFKKKKGRYMDFWTPIYNECEKHAEFTLLGKQFQRGEAQKYGLTKPLEPNLLLTYANHEANKTLQTDYRVKVTPNGSGATEIAARARQDVIRGQMRLNDFTEVGNRVRRQQVCGGIAYSWAKIEYAGKRGYGKKLPDEYIEDWKDVFPDMEVKTSTFSDMRDCLIKQDVPKSEWFDATGRDPDDENWAGKETKEVWHYWVRNDIKDEELLSADGTSTVMRSTLDEDEPDYSNIKMGDDDEPLSRPTTDYSWCWYKIVGDDIVDEEDWLGSYPPIIACTGRKVTNGDKTYYQPLTQFAEEPQKVYTIIENIIALRLSRSPFSKWMIPADSIDVKQMIALRAASVIGDMDIAYKHKDAQGDPIPAPQEIQPYIIDAILLEIQNEQNQKIQRIFGIFDANLGNRSNEQSGVAIQERAKGGELSNYDSQFNYMEWVKQVGRVKLDLIPKYLTAPQQIPFIDTDDQVVIGWVNTTGGVQFSPDEEYQLSVEALPISETAREDEARILIQMVEKMPQITANPKIQALIVQAMPGKYTAKIAEILTNEDPQMQQAQAVIQQQGQQLQAAQAKQLQDKMAIEGLKSSLNMMKQQMVMFKQMKDVEGATAEMREQMEKSEQDLENTIKLLEVQTKQYTAESGRITADAAMLKVVGDLSKQPDPATPQPGQPLP